MRTDVRGFTLIEVVISLVVVAVLVDVATSAVAPAMDQLSADAARRSLASLHAVTRARAVERGTVTRLRIDPVTDSAWAFDGAERIEAIGFADAYGVDLVAGSTVELCFSPRGYADLNCNSFASSVDIGLHRGNASPGLQLRPMGQLVAQ